MPMAAPATTTRTARRRRERERRHAPAPARPLAASLLARAKRAGGPEDRALYACGCGCAFTADVTTSVVCPHCGAEQSW